MMRQRKKCSAFILYCCLVGLSCFFFVGCSSVGSSTTAEEKFATEAQEYLFTGDAEQAIEAYTKAIELNGNDPDYYLNRGMAHTLKLEHEVAIADFNKAIEINPNLAAAFFNRGKVHEALGNAQQAKADFEMAEKLSPPK